MPTVTRLDPQKNRPNRRNVHLDGVFAFGLNLNVVAAFRLRVGQTLSEEQVREIEAGEVRQECFDRALRYISSRLHSRAELRRKLQRREYGDAVVDGVLADLERLNYLDDARFARDRAQSAADRKQHGRRRAFAELVRTGVKKDVAEKAVAEVYGGADTLATARALVAKQAPRLARLDPQVARRHLIGMLQRRGFDYEEIKKVVDEGLGTCAAEDE